MIGASGRRAASEGGGSDAVEGQVREHAILHHGDTVLGREVGDPLSDERVGLDAGRIVIVRVQGDEHGAAHDDGCLELCDVDPVGGQADAVHQAAAAAHRVRESGPADVLGEHGVAGGDELFHEEAECLLAAVRDEDLRGRGGRSVVGHGLGDQFARGGQARGVGLGGGGVEHRSVTVHDLDGARRDRRYRAQQIDV